MSDAAKNTKKELEDLELKQQTLNEVMRNAAEGYGHEKAELDLLMSSLTAENSSRKEKMKTLKELQEKFPGYFDNIKTEKDLNEKLKVAYEHAAEGHSFKGQCTSSR
jgi:hypothetical protein